MILTLPRNTDPRKGLTGTLTGMTPGPSIVKLCRLSKGLLRSLARMTGLRATQGDLGGITYPLVTSISFLSMKTVIPTSQGCFESSVE